MQKTRSAAGLRTEHGRFHPLRHPHSPLQLPHSWTPKQMYGKIWVNRPKDMGQRQVEEPLTATIRAQPAKGADQLRLEQTAPVQPTPRTGTQEGGTQQRAGDENCTTRGEPCAKEAVDSNQSDDYNDCFEPWERLGVKEPQGERENKTMRFSSGMYLLEQMQILPHSTRCSIQTYDPIWSSRIGHQMRYREPKKLVFGGV